MKGVTIMIVDYITGWVISTHTPVKGVTTKATRHTFFTKISTHTPVKGVTGEIWVDGRLMMDFNSHAREGRDTKKHLTNL